MVDIEVGESQGRDLSQTYGVVSAAASFKFIARLGITAFQQISPRHEIWFGTRGSEVQILSPRPIISNNLQQRRTPRNQPTWFWPKCSGARTRINTAPQTLRRRKTVYKIDHSSAMEKPGALSCRKVLNATGSKKPTSGPE